MLLLLSGLKNKYGKNKKKLNKHEYQQPNILGWKVCVFACELGLNFEVGAVI
jgi:hypothetical protein